MPSLPREIKKENTNIEKPIENPKQKDDSPKILELSEETPLKAATPPRKLKVVTISEIPKHEPSPQPVKQNIIKSEQLEKVPKISEEEKKKKQEYIKNKKLHMLICSVFETGLTKEDLPKYGNKIENYWIMDDLTNEKKSLNLPIMFNRNDISVILETKLQLLAGVFFYI